MAVDIHTNVYHNLYGEGEVIKLTDENVYVSFGGKQRIFPYPDAFEKGFLRTEIEVESIKEIPMDDGVKLSQADNKQPTKKLTKQETTEYFYSVSKKYDVLDHTKSDGVHDRFYLGKEGPRKPVFLALSRVGKMCVYFDKSEKAFIENNGFTFETVTSSKVNWDYRTYVDVKDFEAFLELVQSHLGR